MSEETIVQILLVGMLALEDLVWLVMDWVVVRWREKRVEWCCKNKCPGPLKEVGRASYRESVLVKEGLDPTARLLWQASCPNGREVETSQ